MKYIETSRTARRRDCPREATTGPPCIACGHGRFYVDYLRVVEYEYISTTRREVVLWLLSRYEKDTSRQHGKHSNALEYECAACGLQWRKELQEATDAK